MSIFIDKSTRLLVQGITGREGGFHTRQMLEYGTTVVAGVTPGKGGQKFEDTVPLANVIGLSAPRFAKSFISPGDGSAAMSGGLPPCTDVDSA